MQIALDSSLDDHWLEHEKCYFLTIKRQYLESILFHIDFLLQILIYIRSLLNIEYYLQPLTGMFQRYHTASLDILISCSKAHIDMDVL